MRISHIRLRNYRKFRRAEAEFGDGIISINGLNGAGKSTLVEAIAWALYGNDSRILRDKKEGIKYSGATSSDICSVELDFEMEGNNYHLVREMRGKAGTVVAEISANGMVQASTNSAVNTYVEKILGMDADGFMISVFARQKELNALTNLTKEARKRKIERMLGLDAIDDARKMISSDRSETESVLKGMQLALYGDDGRPLIEIKRNLMKDLEKERQELGKKASLLRKKHDSVLNELKIAEDREKEARELRDRFNRVSSEIEKLNISIKHMESEMERAEKELRDIEKKKLELDSLKDAPSILKKKKDELEVLRDEMERSRKKKDLEIRLEKIINDILEGEKKIKSLENDMDDMSSQLSGRDEMELKKNRLVEALRELDGKRSELISRMNSLDSQVIELENSIKDIKNLGPESRCPTCHRPLGIEYEGILQHMREEKTALLVQKEQMRKQLEETGKEIASLEMEIATLEKLLKAASRVEMSISSMKARKEAVKESLESMRREKKRLEEEIKAIGKPPFDEEKYEALKREVEELVEKDRRFQKLLGEISQEDMLRREIENMKEEISEKRTEIEMRENELKSLGFSEGKLEDAENRRKLLQEEERRIHGEIMASEEKIKSHEREAEALLLEIDRLEKDMDTMKKYEEDVLYLKSLEKYMKLFRDEAITRIRPTLQSLASDFFSRMTDGKYPGIELDDEYRIKIIDAGMAYPIERFSGGESDLANLCLRLAISEVVVQARGGRGFNFMVLDEIFGSQDVTRRENIIRALQSLSGRFSQIFLISHIEGIKESASMVFNVKENEDGSSSLIPE